MKAIVWLVEAKRWILTLLVLSKLPTSSLDCYPSDIHGYGTYPLTSNFRTRQAEPRYRGAGRASEAARPTGNKHAAHRNQRRGSAETPHLHGRSTEAASRSHEGFLGSKAESIGQDGESCRGYTGAIGAEAQAHDRRTEKSPVGEDEGGLGEEEGRLAHLIRLSNLPAE